MEWLQRLFVEPYFCVLQQASRYKPIAVTYKVHQDIAPTKGGQALLLQWC